MIQLRKKGEEAWYNPDRDIVNLLPNVVSEIFAVVTGAKEDPKLLEYLEKAEIADPKSEDHIAFATRLGAFITKAHTVKTFEELCESTQLNQLPADKVYRFLAAIGWVMLQAYHDGATDLNPKAAQIASRPEEIKSLIKEYEEKAKASL